jgi:hypothetical protein
MDPMDAVLSQNNLLDRIFRRALNISNNLRIQNLFIIKNKLNRIKKFSSTSIKFHKIATRMKINIKQLKNETVF